MKSLTTMVKLKPVQKGPLGFEEEGAEEDRIYENFIFYDKNKKLQEGITRGITSAIRTFYMQNPNDPSYEKFIAQGYKKADDWTEKVFDGYLTSVIDKLRHDGLLDNIKANVEEEPEEEFDLSEASPELQRLVDLFQNGDDAVDSTEKIVAEKFKKIEKLALRVSSGRNLKKHAFICGAAGIGKSYTVGKAAEIGVARNVKKPELLKNSGSIGRAISNIVLFFFLRKDDKIIILDDCDDFLTSNDQAVKNFFKAILDPDEHAASVAPTIRKRVNAALQAGMSESTGNTISIDKQKLKEGILDVKVNNFSIGEVELIKEAQEELNNLFNVKTTFDENCLTTSRGNKLNNLINGRSLKEGLFDAPTIEHKGVFTKDEDNDNISDNELLENPDLDTNSKVEIPSEFKFTSSIIVISNLYASELDEAFHSRCTIAEITLTEKEFLCRLKEILPNLLTKTKSSLPPEEIDWAKKCAYLWLTALIEAKSNRVAIGGKQVQVNIPLEFRIMTTLTDLWLTRVDDYVEETGETDKGEIEQAISLDFCRYDLMPVLRGDTAR